eukprot:3067156-Prymnesium_polylepis.1
MELVLFGRAAPMTVENFVGLCTGDHGTSEAGTRMHYVGTKFHRVMAGFMAQGGNTARDAAGGQGESIWGGAFADESFALSHDAPGVLSMANAGANTNRAQFFMLFAAQ